MKKYVIYTAVIGAYDNIMQPSVIDADFDYILFSDCITESNIGVWEVRHIDYTNPDKTKIARYAKTHSHSLLSEYACSIWIDASIAIKTDYLYQRAKELCAKGSVVATMVHPDRDCIYDEAVVVVMNNFETVDRVLTWLNYLHENQYPEHNGLCETGILYRLHTDETTQLNEEWWNCILTYSRRDQLSFNYALWKLQMNVMNLFSSDFILRDSEHVTLVAHTHATHRDAYYNSTMPMLLRILDYYPEYEAIIKQTYSRAFHSTKPRLVIGMCTMQLYPRYIINYTYKNFKRKLKRLIGKK